MRVIPTVHLDDRPQLRRQEIHDEAADHGLPHEPDAKPPATKRTPELGAALAVRWSSPERDTPSAHVIV
jgi:hypothetical protein